MGSKGGRRSMLTKDRRRRLVEGVQLGMTYRLAAQYAGISVSTLYGWLRRGREKNGPPFVALLD